MLQYWEGRPPIFGSGLPAKFFVPLARIELALLASEASTLSVKLQRLKLSFAIYKADFVRCSSLRRAKAESTGVEPVSPYGH